ncbi:MAG TPA: chemotaxis response regulator protein-glutamate methylesterase [Fimbriimonadaceae bacterium]|nr:chemotaxis response regulator protein-glutamate methylesterase [Fimbriimonadaceae bacterium]
MRSAISVLVVDDSAFMRKVVTQILIEGGLVVLGQARDGHEAIEKAASLRPDVITLDVEMPGMDGITALKEITEKLHIPVVMLSSLTQAGAVTTLRCLEQGAVDFVAKPSGAISLNIREVGAEIVAKVRTAAQVKVVPATISAAVKPLAASRGLRRSLVLIGSSTGGPRALQAVIPALPGNLMIPIVVVQHMPPAFTATLAERLNQSSALSVKEAAPGDRLTPGQVLVAPGGHHLEFDGSGRASINDGPVVHGVRPAIDVTLASLVRTYGPSMVGVLLTGMGSDGALGLKAIRDSGGFTIAESESTCVVYGMPKAAVDLGAATVSVPLGQIAAAITDAVSEPSSGLRAS